MQVEKPSNWRAFSGCGHAAASSLRAVGDRVVEPRHLGSRSRSGDDVVVLDLRAGIGEQVGAADGDAAGDADAVDK